MVISGKSRKKSRHQDKKWFLKQDFVATVILIDMDSSFSPYIAVNIIGV